MNTLPELAGCPVHFIGVKGTGMTALAEIFRDRGAVITGSDVDDVFYTDAILASLGIVPRTFHASHIPAEVKLVVYSAAYTAENNPEMAAAVKMGVPMLKYPEALGLLSRESFSVGICGVHGKTTTAGMVGTILSELALDATVLAGSAMASFGGRSTIRTGLPERTAFSSLKVPPPAVLCPAYFVAETCEYRRHFLNFSPSMILLTSVESDHQDYYPTYESIRGAFVEYCVTLPEGGVLLYCADDPGAAEVAEAAKKARPDLRLLPYGEEAQRNLPVPLKLQVPGKHLLQDAVGAALLAIELLKKEEPGAGEEDWKKIARALEKFAGAKRRSEIVGEESGILVADDYAHHPTAIRMTLEGFREKYPERRIICDFMSHTYSRTLALLKDFGRAFDAADAVLLHDIYGSAREAENSSEFRGLDRRFLDEVQKHHRAVFFAADPGSEEALDKAQALSTEKTPSLFITMGAGDNWKLGKRLLERLGETGNRRLRSLSKF